MKIMRKSFEKKTIKNFMIRKTGRLTNKRLKIFSKDGEMKM